MVLILYLSVDVTIIATQKYKGFFAFQNKTASKLQKGVLTGDF